MMLVNSGIIYNHYMRHSCYLRIFFLIIISNFILANEVYKPAEGEILNYTQVFFTWPQIPSSNIYELTIHDIDDEITYSISDSLNLIICSEFLEFGKSYYWQVCGFDSNELTYCFDTINFSISTLPEAFTHEINIEVFNEDQVFLQNGVTLVNPINLDKSYGLNYDGTPIWFSNINVVDLLINGSIISFKSILLSTL